MLLTSPRLSGSFRLYPSPSHPNPALNTASDTLSDYLTYDSWVGPPGEDPGLRVKFVVPKAVLPVPDLKLEPGSSVNIGGLVKTSTSGGTKQLQVSGDSFWLNETDAGSGLQRFEVYFAHGGGPIQLPHASEAWILESISSQTGLSQFWSACPLPQLDYRLIVARHRMDHRPERFREMRRLAINPGRY